MAETKRPTVEAAEEILGGYCPVLDHGFVSLADYMGSGQLSALRELIRAMHTGSASGRCWSWPISSSPPRCPISSWTSAA